MSDVLHSSRHLSRPAGSFVLLLILLAAAIGAIDWVWAIKGNFAIAGHAYAALAAMSVLLWGAGYVYATWRPEPRLAAMLFGTGFLIAFTAAASVLNTMLLTVAGPRIDSVLAQADIAMGFDWPAMMRDLANHPTVLLVLQLAYGVLLPQIALAVVVLGTWGRIASLYRFILAVAIGALICIFIWSLFPAFGAMSVYHFDHALAARLHVPVDEAYGRALIKMLQEGPGPITPDSIKGLIGFPSFHAVLAMLLIWYLRDVRWVRWPALVLNVTVIFATPIEGGHHWVDVFAAVPVTVLAIALSRHAFTRAAQLDFARTSARSTENIAAPAA